MKNSGEYLTDEQIAERVEMFMYVRDENNNPIGIVVKMKDGNYGWSLYNKKAERESYFGKPFDKGLGILIATDPGRDNRLDYVLDEIQHRIELAEQYDTKHQHNFLYFVASALGELADISQMKAEKNNHGATA